MKVEQKFEECLQDYIFNFLLYEIPYVARLDKLYNTNLRRLPYKERLERFKFTFAPEGKKMVLEYFTLCYLAHGVKESGKLDDADYDKFIPLIEQMFIDEE